MTTTSNTDPIRVLVLDEHEPIHDDFRKVLEVSDTWHILQSHTAKLFGEDSQESSEHSAESDSYAIDSALEIEAASKLVTESIEQHRPFSLAFVDLGIAPQWVGTSNIDALMAIDPQLHVIAVSSNAYHPFQAVREQLGRCNQVIMLRKPFEPAEVRQLAQVMVDKWRLARIASETLQSHEEVIRQHTERLQAQNDELRRQLATARRAEEQLKHDALHDGLTSLPNRTLLMERLRGCIERSRRLEDHFQFAVLMLDLDNFKVINDSLGHPIGDKLLIEMSHRLEHCVRGLDTTSRPLDETTARLGGDEFVILLEDIHQPAEASQVASRILDALSQPVRLEGHDIVTSATIGIATSELKYSRPEDILRDADTALYDAKGKGKGRYAVFNRDMHSEAVARLELEDDLRKGVLRKQFRLHYQPIMSLTERRLDGFEVLIRWEHPGRGILTPAEFLPLAEETGLIVPIGKWVLMEACQQLMKWRTKFPNMDEVGISVNLTVRQFIERNFINQVDQIIELTGFDPRLLHLELTESIIVEYTRIAAQVLNEIRDRHIGLRMEDFGTGLTSMSYLEQLPIDALKVDRAFVGRIGKSSRDNSTVDAIVTLAHNQDIRVIAEGIETQEQIEYLQGKRCEFGQGFYFAAPLTVTEADEWLRQHTSA